MNKKKQNHFWSSDRVVFDLTKVSSNLSKIEEGDANDKVTFTEF